MCDNCDYDSNDIDNDDLTVCKTCYKLETKVLITKSRASELYPINKTDLDTVRHIEYKGTYTTYLFLIKDIEYICIKKYGSVEKYKSAMMEKNKKKEDRVKYANNSKDFRRHELDTYLKSICLPGIRNDSVLCTNYIEKGDKSGFSKERIGQIMLEMKFYFDKTDYQSLLYILKGEEIEDRREYKGFYVWTDDDEEMVRQEAKDKALYKYIKNNCNNNHNLILEIPKSLKQKADTIYLNLCKKGLIGSGLQNTVNQDKINQGKVNQDKVNQGRYDLESVYSQYEKSKIKFNETQRVYDSIFSEANI